MVFSGRCDPRNYPKRRFTLGLASSCFSLTARHDPAKPFPRRVELGLGFSQLKARMALLLASERTAPLVITVVALFFGHADRDNGIRRTTTRTREFLCCCILVHCGMWVRWYVHLALRFHTDAQ